MPLAVKRGATKNCANRSKAGSAKSAKISNLYVVVCKLVDALDRPPYTKKALFREELQIGEKHITKAPHQNHNYTHELPDKICRHFRLQGYMNLNLEK